MNHTCTRLREVVTSVLHLKLDGLLPITTTTINDDTAEFSKSRCNVDGHNWEIRFHPSLYVHGDSYCPGLDLVFLGESRPGVTAILSAKITNHSGHGDGFVAYKDKKSTLLRVFHQPLDRSLPIYIGVGIAYKAGVAADHPKRCSLTVECTITVFKDPASAEGASNLGQNLGELLRSAAAADVTFSVSGETFAAHRSVLAARSAVFMAEFFGEKKESIKFQVVEIQDMDSEVFKAMLHFIYTDAVPELDEKEPEAAAMALALAQRLAMAADRYGLHRLIVMCKRKIAISMDAGTVASMLALAEKLNCSQLKAKCIEFIVGGSPENLDAVLATEGYKHLAASSPSVLTEILKAAHGKKSACPSCKMITNGSSVQHKFTSIQAATLRSVKHTCTQLNEGVQSVHLLKIDGFSVTKDTIGNNTGCLKSRCTVDGHDMEIRFYPAQRHHQDVYVVALELTYLGETNTHGVEVTLSGRIVQYQNSGVAPKEFEPVTKTFTHPSDCTLLVYIGKGKVRDSLPSPAASMTVECAITVFRDLNAIRLPASELHQHLYELLHSRAGADITFNVSGESFTAHKNILAARSPVFKAEFFGEMEEKTSGFVEIVDLDAQVFKAMLRFIYSDMVPTEF